MAKVLLVEDDNNLREIFAMRLKAEGYEISTAGDGEEALAIAVKEKPDLLVADIMMPRLSGFEMLENLRAAPGLQKTKVIMMTALGQAEDQARGEQLGVVKYLVKSQVTLEDFVRVVRAVMNPGSDQSPTNKRSSNMDDPTNQPTPAGGAPTPGGNDPMPAPDSSGGLPGGPTPQTTQDEKNDVADQVGSAMGGPGGDTAGPTPMPEPKPDETPTPGPTPTPPAPDAGTPGGSNPAPGSTVDPNNAAL